MVVLIAALVFAASAGASAGWHIFATGQDSGSYGAYASANASVLKPQRLAIRVSREADVSWTLSCDATTHVPADKIVVVSIANSGTCRLYGSANTDAAGTLKIQLLKR